MRGSNFGEKVNSEKSCSSLLSFIFQEETIAIKKKNKKKKQLSGLKL